MRLRTALLLGMLLVSCRSTSDPEPLEDPKVTARVEPWAASESYLVIVEIEDREHPGSMVHLEIPARSSAPGRKQSSRCARTAAMRSDGRACGR